MKPTELPEAVERFRHIADLHDDPHAILVPDPNGYWIKFSDLPQVIEAAVEEEAKWLREIALSVKEETAEEIVRRLVHEVNVEAERARKAEAAREQAVEEERERWKKLVEDIAVGFIATADSMEPGPGAAPCLTTSRNRGVASAYRTAADDLRDAALDATKGAEREETTNG